ncbi:3-isopropylmalate dehydrogenase [Listeria costaricensis]|uniref:3-isopropylmalate dehydrogenase n=1 Tax=Listeria costaricensis TaxID=2026604 RepID=UPI000C089E4F|nr:3-isopropylmalate dehydrogenase [Listeria costaricensis]
MKTYHIVALPGDGIGPEIMKCGLDVLDAVAKEAPYRFEITEKAFGGTAIDQFGEPLPQDTLEAAKKADAILLAAIGGPQWDEAEKRPEAGLLALRKALDLFANIRPIQVPAAVSHLSPLKEDRVAGCDFIVVRELTGGLYFGEPKQWNEHEATDTLYYQAYEIERIIDKAFLIARSRRKKVTSVDKANVLASSKLWRKIAEQVAARYPDVELEHLYVDAASMLLIQAPKKFDVLVTENMFGDIISDEASVIPGSLGLLPSASHAENGPSLYEPIHGSAPDIAGQNIANPMSMILSVAMMLRQSFQLHEAAEKIEQATSRTMESGCLTKDLGGNATTTAFTEAVIQEIQKGAVQNGTNTF